MSGQRVDHYWSKRFGVEPDLLHQNGMWVVPHVRPQKNDDNFVFVFVRGPTCLLSVAAVFVDATRERAGALAPDTFLSERNLQQLFDRPIHHTVGPAYQGYAEKEHFSGVSSGRVHIVNKHDEVLRRLAADCEPIAWEHSAIERADSAIFASFIHDQLVAIAHYSMWSDHAASIGVLTHPAHRNRGHGKTVVSAAVEDAFAHGHFVLYQTLVANHASVAVARALGCREYARTIAVHLTAAAGG